MKCYKCPRCFQYMKKRKSRNVPVNFWCKHCQVWANYEYYSVRIKNLYMVRWINNITEKKLDLYELLIAN